MKATGINEPKRGAFFQLFPDFSRDPRGHGVAFVNLEALLTPPRLSLRPREGGFPVLREVPQLTYRPTDGAPPRDLEGGLSGYWLVSERLRRVMEAVDPEAFAFVETDYRLADGSKGPAVYLCDVVRTLDALDEGTSELDIKVSDDYESGKRYNLAGGSRLAFKSDVLAGAHVFRLAHHGGVFCDRFFKGAVKAAGIGAAGRSDGLWFDDVVNQ